MSGPLGRRRLKFSFFDLVMALASRLKKPEMVQKRHQKSVLPSTTCPIVVTRCDEGIPVTKGRAPQFCSGPPGSSPSGRTVPSVIMAMGKMRRWSLSRRPSKEAEKKAEPEDDGRVNVRAYNKKVRNAPRAGPRASFVCVCVTRSPVRAACCTDGRSDDHAGPEGHPDGRGLQALRGAQGREREYVDVRARAASLARARGSARR